MSHRRRRSTSANATRPRKIIFIISDGREYGSKSLIAMRSSSALAQRDGYAVGVESAPSRSTASLKAASAHYGYGDILPKYAKPGRAVSEFNRDNIELAYQRATGMRATSTLWLSDPRHPSRPIATSRSGGPPGLKISTKTGYYPLPAAR